MTIRYTDHQRGAVDRRVLVVFAAIVVLALVAILLMREPEAPPATAAPAGQQAAADKPSASSPPAAIQQSAQPAAAESARTAPPVAASTKEPQIEWKGRVLSEATGAPIAGALVEVLATERESERLDATSTRYLQVKPPVLASATTDANGEWTLSARKPDAGVGSEYLYASAEGYASRMAYVSLEEWSTGDPLTIVLFAGGTVSGMVVDGQGVGIDGAVVGGRHMEKMDPNPRDYGVFLQHAAWTTTGKDGRFTLAGLREGAGIIVPAYKDGYVTGISQEVLPGATDVRIVLLAGGGTINGRVLEADGRPARSVDLWVHPVLSADVDYRRGPILAPSARVDAEGVFQLKNLAAHKWRITARRRAAPGSPGEEVSREVDLESVYTADVELRFQRPVTIIGQVIDSGTKAGVPGIRLSSSAYGRNLMSGGVAKVPFLPGRVEAISDGTGAFRIAIPFRDPAQLFVDVPDGWILDSRPAGLPGMIAIAGVAGGEEHTVEVRLKRATLLRGKVLDAPNAPAVGAVVTAREELYYQTHGARTDSNGVFSMTVPLDRTLNIKAATEIGWGEAVAEVPAAGTPPEVTIVLQGYATVSGQVRSVAGEPVKAVTFLITRTSMGGHHRDASTSQVTSDASGRYVLSKLRPGTTTIAARIPAGLSYAAPDPLTLELSAGEIREGVDFALKRGDFIEGVVLGEDQEPVVGATVRWWVTRTAGTTVSDATTPTTDEKGYYRITGLAENDVVASMTVSHADYEPASRTNVTVLDGEQNFILKKKAKVYLVALDEATNQPVPRYDYLLSGTNELISDSLGQTGTRVDNAEGRTRLSLNGPHKVNVIVAEIDSGGKPTGRRGAARYTPTGEQEQVVTVRIGGGYTISGTVVRRQTLEPIAGATVSAGMTSGTFSTISSSTGGSFDFPKAVTDGDGRFTLSGLVAGSYRLIAARGGLAPIDAPKVDLAAGTTPEPVTIRMAAAAAIHGKVTLFDGGPGKNASLQLYDQSTNSFNQFRQADSTGNYRFEGVTPATYALQLYPNDQRSVTESRQFALKEGEDLELNFDLSGTIRLSGVVRMNGQPWQENGASLYLSGEHTSGFLRSKGEGRYEAQVRPGTHQLKLQAQNLELGTIQTVQIPETPAEQQMDFDIATASADIVLDVEEGVPFTPGYVGLERRTSGETINLNSSIRLDRNRRHVPCLLPGDYRARYFPDDRSLTGASDWTSITPGGENVIYVPVKKANR